MRDPNEILCKYERMEEWKSILENVSQTMGMLSNSSIACRQIFRGAYKGDALAEVDLFFESLNNHLIRLGGLYAKMSEYIGMTNETFNKVDAEQAEKMGE